MLVLRDKSGKALGIVKGKHGNDKWVLLAQKVNKLIKLLWRGCSCRKSLLEDEQYAAMKLYSIQRKRK